MGVVWSWRVVGGVFGRALAGLFSGGGWLVGGCGVLECWVAVWLVGVFMGGAQLVGAGTFGWLARDCLLVRGCTGVDWRGRFGGGALAGSSTGWLAGAGDYGGEFGVGRFRGCDW